MLHSVNAQSNIVAGGGDANSSTGSVSYSIGQIESLIKEMNAMKKLLRDIQ